MNFSIYSPAYCKIIEHYIEDLLSVNYIKQVPEMVRQGRQQNICNLILIQTFETVTEFS
jgi:predicted DNA-binding protein